MFGFLKDKIKSWIGTAKDSLSSKVPEQTRKEKKKETKVKKEKLQEGGLGKSKKVEKKQKTTAEISEERKTTEKIKQDIHKENLEIKSPEEKFEKVIRVEAEKEEQIEENEAEETKPQEQKKGFFSKLRSFLSYQVTEEDFEEMFSDLEMLLLESNVALEVVEEIKKKLKQELVDKEIKKSEIETKIKEGIKNALENILIDPEDIIKQIKNHKKENSLEPFKILFFGINGAGKTTSIAKIGNLLHKNKITYILAAADTFRAASIEQLQIHADRLGAKMIKHDYNSDPSAVAFDAIKYAKQNKIDVVLIDTAGRMHTKENLLKEMEKICKVTQPNLKVFVAEAIAGNDATEQAKAFNEMIGVDGSILSKTDVDEKGGTIISISFITKKPILYLGTGQNYDDLELFNKEKFIKRLGL